MAHPTTHWHRLDGGRLERAPGPQSNRIVAPSDDPHGEGRIVCDVCPRHCRLHEGQRGFCFVRACHGGAITLETYGRSSGFCVDPIEKKPLHHFLPGTAVLSFGTAGCNLGCRFCQNWEITKSRETDTLADEASPEEIADAAVRAGCPSVAFTYNDPVVFLEYAIDTARACRARGVRTVAVTAGYVEPAPRAEFFAWMDAANVDLKGFTEEFHRDVCAAHLAPVLDTLRYVKHETRTWLEITNLVIPGHNDAPAEIDAMTRWIAAELGPDVPLHFTAFHPAWRMQDVPPTPLSTLRRCREQALANGLRYVYTGNVRDEDGAATRCAGCHAVLIGREGYDITEWTLGPGGRCRACDAVLPGVFGDAPGRWGAHRVPVRLSRRPA